MGAAGGLGAADLEQMGFTTVAVDVLELALGPGIDRVLRLGGAGPFTGWRGPVLGVARSLGADPVTAGWRARGLPGLRMQDDGSMLVRSALDGSRHLLPSGAFEAWCEELGVRWAAEGTAALWDSPATPPPSSGLVVTTVPGDQAVAGMVRMDGSWQPVNQLPAPGEPGGDEPLDAACSCRGCRVANQGWLRHLWDSREITAPYLIGTHNLQALAVELGAGAA
jgi:hypothetical protein